MTVHRPVVLLTTAGSLPEAERLSRLLLEKRLAACVNLSSIRSRYRWQGKIERGKEVLLLVKTEARHLKAIGRCIRSAHSYEVPELIALPIQWGEKHYLRWLIESVR